MSDYTKTWDTTSVVNGPHTIGVVISDAAGNKASDSIDVLVNNNVEPPSPSNLTVVEPASGAIWKNGKARLIKWLSKNVLGNVKIEFITNGTLSVIFPNIPNTGSTSWVVGSKSNSCTIRVSSVNDPTCSGLSGVFRIN